MPIGSLAFLLDNAIIFDGVAVKVDGITGVSPANSKIVTQHPIEDGFNISDAQHYQPIQVSFQAWITDTPQSLFDSRVLTAASNSSGLNVSESHVKKQLETIEGYANTGALISVKTKYAQYEDYYLLSFSYTETSEQAILISFAIMELQTSADESRTTANFDNDVLGLWS